MTTIHSELITQTRIQKIYPFCKEQWSASGERSLRSLHKHTEIYREVKGEMERLLPFCCICWQLFIIQILPQQRLIASPSLCNTPDWLIKIVIGNNGTGRAGMPLCSGMDFSSTSMASPQLKTWCSACWTVIGIICNTAQTCFINNFLCFLDRLHKVFLVWDLGKQWHEILKSGNSPAGHLCFPAIT